VVCQIGLVNKAVTLSILAISLVSSRSCFFTTGGKRRIRFFGALLCTALAKLERTGDPFAAAMANAILEPMMKLSNDCLFTCWVFRFDLPGRSGPIARETISPRSGRLPLGFNLP
jgi:hypothetical protein